MVREATRHVVTRAVTTDSRVRQVVDRRPRAVVLTDHVTARITGTWASARHVVARLVLVVVPTTQAVLREALMKNSDPATFQVVWRDNVTCTRTNQVVERLTGATAVSTAQVVARVVGATLAMVVQVVGRVGVMVARVIQVVERLVETKASAPAVFHEA
jgi:hypothetical protein